MVLAGPSVRIPKADGATAEDSSRIHIGKGEIVTLLHILIQIQDMCLEYADLNIHVRAKAPPDDILGRSGNFVPTHTQSVILADRRIVPGIRNILPRNAPRKRRRWHIPFRKSSIVLRLQNVRPKKVAVPFHVAFLDQGLRTEIPLLLNLWIILIDRIPLVIQNRLAACHHRNLRVLLGLPQDIGQRGIHTRPAKSGRIP